MRPAAPKGLQQVVPEGSTKRLCAPITTTRGADTMKFDTHCVSYTKVCGRITGYQFGTTEAFHGYATAARTTHIGK